MSYELYNRGETVYALQEGDMNGLPPQRVTEEEFYNWKLLKPRGFQDSGQVNAPEGVRGPERPDHNR